MPTPSTWHDDGVTAPLTPHDNPTPAPEPLGATAYVPPDPRDQEPAVTRAEVVEAVLVSLAVGVLGVLMGLLWLWLAPRVELIADKQAIYIKNSEGENAIGADGLFVLLGLGMGVLTAVAVFLFRRRGGIALVLGLALGGILGSVLAWRLGVFFGPESDIKAHARQVGPGVTFDKPLELAAKGALLAWPAAAMAVHLALTGLFGPRDHEPEQGHGAAYPAPPAPAGPTPPPADRPAGADADAEAQEAPRPTGRPGDEGDQRS
ncbi:hypothetical protein ACZ90_65600 [Streptomyces albus subsp. albus]|nr:hypothetical protein ACZ90_65600 [Streptomyces albus subsp. albus]